MIQTRALVPADAGWAATLIRERWLGPFVVTRGRIHDTRELPGFVACADGRRLGLLLYVDESGDTEIVTLDALEQRRGIGRSLLAAVRSHALERGSRRVWLVTTNDNLAAIAFYTDCGFRLVDVHLDAVALARELKPEIPATGHSGLPLRDELEFSVSCESPEASI
ncbi:GNAT family N-acetyltransferase [Opitutus terrae]|uniref:GCN5-related N-acetyltransferase n=1 Tax=Opitutus terrae (strain DSM 11246 / JCM 15787 / PB90-1) TaxID=452637 RepID=B1ZX07_OPITP|nr:GNAT family N-acetyltransferase [Opitutus terrae]ACB75118.1 GCN5-related N-acetyltransferase [Opitutus terrae PB90-1]